MKGGDHMASLEPDELKSLISGIRLIEKALGQKQKIIRPSEIPCTKKVGKGEKMLALKKQKITRCVLVLITCSSKTHHARLFWIRSV